MVTENIYVNGKGMADRFHVRDMGKRGFEVERKVNGRRKWLSRGPSELWVAAALLYIQSQGYRKVQGGAA